MTQSDARDTPPHSVARHAEVASLPLAAALTLVVARALPVRFEHEPNALGIVSLATLERYPVAQETFWFLFAAASSFVAALGLAHVLRARAFTPARGLALEVASLATLATLLFLPAAWTWLALVPVGLVLVLARGAPRIERSAHELPSDEHTPLRAATRARWLALLVVLALGASPALPLELVRTLRGVPDEALTSDSWNFHGEMGQHLAACDMLRAGLVQGRDYFALYGPYVDLALVGLWELVGRSLASTQLYVALLFAGGTLGALLATWTLCRRKAGALFFVPLARPVNLRHGLGLFALAALAPWLRGGARAWCGLAGLVAGFALFFSQEFGLALLVTIGLAFLVRSEVRALAWFAAGFALPVVPLIAWLAAKGALGPLLHDMAGYPAWVAAGFGKVPFPPLFSSLPLGLARAEASLRTGYLLPALCVSALALCAMVAPLEPARPWRFPLALRRAWRARPEVLLVALVAFYGFVSFRSALGRSDALHLAFVIGAPTVLVVLALERTFGLFARPELRAVAAWRVLALLALAWFGSLPQTAASFGALRRSAGNVVRVLSGRTPPDVGNVEVNAVAAWIRAHTAPEDRVAHVPAGAGYQYLTERREPTRFLLCHQMVTDAHRAEALADLERRPPKYVVFDPGATRVDGLADELVLGPTLTRWLAQHYELDAEVRGVRIHRRRAE